MKRIFASISISRHIFFVSALGFVLLLLSGLTLPLTTTYAHAADANTSYVRVIHASPYIGAADVFVDGKPLLNAFRFAQVTDYVPLPAGTHRVQVALMGKGLNAALITQDLPVQPGIAYTIAAIGDKPSTLGLHVFEDNNQLIANQTKVRLYALAPDASAVKVTVGGNTTFNGISYQQASDYVKENTGPCLMTVTDTSNNTQLSLTSKLLANTVTSVFSVGLFNGTPGAQLVAANAQGIPGMPQTGAAPVLQSGNIGFIVSWLVALVMLAWVAVVSMYGMGRRGKA